MEKIYFTITGTNHYHGKCFLEPAMKVQLVKEPDNVADKEAIKVTMPGLGTIGYVANSPYTVIGESHSAGRLYDKIGETATGTILYIMAEGVLCTLDDGDLSLKRNPETGIVEAWEEDKKIGEVHAFGDEPLD